MTIMALFSPVLNWGFGIFILEFGALGPDSNGFEDLTEIDLYLGYSRTWLEEEPYSFTTDLLYTYFTYPKTNRGGDAQEVGLTVSWDQLIPLGPTYLVPSYSVFYDWDGVQGSGKVDDGFFHTFALTYDIPVPALIPSQEEQAISLLADITYGDGAFDTEPAWSYSTLGASTTFEWNSMYFTPALYYQFSFEDSVNNEDDLYAMFSVGYSF